MQNFSIAPQEMVASLWRNWNLARTLARREVLGRYRGSLMGVVWSVVNPVLMLGIYTFIFSVVFKARWGSESSSRVEFALVLFVGIIVFNVFSESVGRAPGLIISNANYVKRVIFPLDLLAWTSMGAVLFHFCASLSVWLLAYVIFFGVPHATVLLLPLIVIPLVFFVMGLNWFLASLGVFLRDVSQIVGFIVTAMMFLSPIFYPASALPKDYQFLIFLNPLTPAIEMARDVLYWGKVPDLTLLSLYSIVALLVAWVGFSWFQKTRKGFADVL
jgi:lipopolysaccharide transport system permease protein